MSQVRQCVVPPFGRGLSAAALMFLTGRLSASGRSRNVVARTPSLAATHRGAFLAGGFAVGLVVMAFVPGQSWGQLGFGLLLCAGYALAVLLPPASRTAESAQFQES